MIVKMHAIFALAALLQIFSCQPNQEQKPLSFSPKVVEARGYVVPKDSMVEPRVVLAGKPTVVRAGKPVVIPIKSNVHPAGIPKVVPAGAPRVCTPGKDSFSLPKIVPADETRVIAGIPEVVAAKESYPSRNTQNFRSFGKLQGLKGADIICLLQDKQGNLWIGTNASGLIKYDGKNFTHFTTHEGLRQNFVKGLVEDKSSNLWMGTSTGLTKYDGHSFIHFDVMDSLSENWVQGLYFDKTDNLWAITMGGGVYQFDGKSFKHFTEKEGLSNRILCIYQDKKGNLWFGTSGEGVIQYNWKSFSHFTEKEGLSSNVVTTIAEDQDHNLWFGTLGRGLNKYDGKSFSHFTEKEGLINNDVRRILKDKDGILWFGTGGGGVSRFDGKNFTQFTDKEGLNNYEVWSILEDRSGNLWFGTGGGGVSIYGGRNFRHFTQIESLSAYRTMSIIEDKGGNLWFGTRGGGVTKYDGKSFSHFTEKEGLVHNLVWNIAEDSSGSLWFATLVGVSKYDGKTFTNFTETQGLGNNDVHSVLPDKHGNLWFGSIAGITKYDGETFTYFTEKSGLPKKLIMCLSLLEDNNGNLWFGTGGGLAQYDGVSFTHFTVKEGLSNNIVRSIVQDTSGNLWLGTGGGGITKYDGRKFTHFTEKEGLVNNDITSAIKTKNGNLWFGTGAGLSKLGTNKLSPKDQDSAIEPKLPFTNYTYDNGFAGVGVNFGNTICEAKDGTLWIGADDRLTVFHPGEEIPDTIAPNIQVTGITLFNENIPWQNLLSNPEDSNARQAARDSQIILGNGVLLHDFYFDSVSKWYGLPENLSLPYDNNHVEIQFTGVTIHSPKKVKYQYKLDGADKNWSVLTNRSEASYGNLPPGKYTFKVKAVNGDGYWSKEFQSSFTIRPPWWHTWWAYMLFAILVASFIYALFRYRLNKMRTQHEMVLQKQKASELEMQALRSQMNPHFIFNSLNSINMFILENDKLQASEYLSKFSRLVRLILQNSREAFIPLERELEALQLYLELESLRFEKRFEFKVTVDEEVDTTMLKVPPLLIQPYAENAIWHGLMHKKETGHLTIELYLVGKVLHCKICDDGIGRKKAGDLKSKSASINKSMGMRITADRIENLQREAQKDIHLTVTDIVLADGSPGGTEVLIKIPVSYD